MAASRGAFYALRKVRVLFFLSRLQALSLNNDVSRERLCLLHCSWQKRLYQTEKNKVFGDNRQEETEKKTSVNKDTFTKILLIGQDEKMTAMTLEEATRLAKRRNLNLVKTKDEHVKSDIEIYKLVSSGSLQREDTGKASSKSTPDKEKILTLKWKISPHDLDVKTKQIKKWIEKGSIVRVLISGQPGNPTAAETVFQSIESGMQEDGKIVQKRLKGDELRFQIVPLKK